jgi:hypothetical protein
MILGYLVPRPNEAGYKRLYVGICTKKIGAKEIEQYSIVDGAAGPPVVRRWQQLLAKFTKRVTLEKSFDRRCGFVTKAYREVMPKKRSVLA